MNGQMWKSCPKCGCTEFRDIGFRTADGHDSWQDADGKWYNGPARETLSRACANCGETQTRIRERGKLVSVEPVTA